MKCLGLLEPSAETAGRAYAKVMTELTKIGDAARLDSDPDGAPGKGRGKWLFAVDERRKLRKAFKDYRSRICSSQRNNAALREQIDAKVIQRWARIQGNGHS